MSTNAALPPVDRVQVGDGQGRVGLGRVDELEGGGRPQVGDDTQVDVHGEQRQILETRLVYFL